MIGLHDKVLLQNLSKLAFIHLYEVLVRPHLEYGMPACSQKPLGRYHPFRADTTISCKIFTSLLDIDSNLFFLPPTRRGLKGAPQ